MRGGTAVCCICALTSQAVPEEIEVRRSDLWFAS